MNLGELRRYSGCHFQRDMDRGRLTISLERTSEEVGAGYGVFKGGEYPAGDRDKLGDFDPQDDATAMPFRVADVVVDPGQA